MRLNKQVVEPRYHSNPHLQCPTCTGRKGWKAKRCKKCQTREGKPPQDNRVYVIESVRCRRVPLTQGKYATINACDYKSISGVSWSYSNGYAQANLGRKNGIPTMVLMHWLIRGKNSDHVNGYGTDNRRKNLRIATKSQNAANSKMNANNTSGYRGVSKDDRMRKGTRRWTAKITVGNERVHIGSFTTAEAAARARDKVARKRFGEFASLNFPRHRPTV